VGSRTCLEDVERRKACPYRDSNSDPSLLRKEGRPYFMALKNTYKGDDYVRKSVSIGR
jgi:hypothetical protein